MSSLHFLIFCESALVEALQNNALSACDRKHTGVMDATILRRRQQYKRGEEEGCSSGYMRLCLHLQELLVGLAAMTVAKAHFNFIIQRLTQSAVPLYCHLMPSAELAF